MKFITSLQLTAAVLLISLSVVRTYDYEEIRKWNASCFPKDTCSEPRDLDDSDIHNCDCSGLCVLYDTCCIDSPFLNMSEKYERVASCRPTGESGENIFMVDLCSAKYRGPVAIRRRCEQTVKNWRDPFKNIPVTNKKTFTTYKSIFCAICNGEKAKDLTVWQVLIDCSALKEYKGVCIQDRDFLLESMIFNPEKGNWGIWIRKNETDWKFTHLHLNYKLPPDAEIYVQQCRPNLISECPATWKNERIKRMCQDYMGAVYIDAVGFRNVHCAICNGVTDFTSISCHGSSPAEVLNSKMSFGVLLDVNLRDGEMVGNIEKKCSEKEVYDPFAKKCRTIECPLPGYTLKEGKCVQG